MVPVKPQSKQRSNNGGLKSINNKRQKQYGFTRRKKKIPNHQEVYKSKALVIIITITLMASFNRPNLPSGWSEHVDGASGGYYYHHAAKNLTQWQIPTATMEETSGTSTSQKAVQMRVQYCGG